MSVNDLNEDFQQRDLEQKKSEDKKRNRVYEDIEFDPLKSEEKCKVIDCVIFWFFFSNFDLLGNSSNKKKNLA